jgi:hypothetical protein
MNEEELKKKIRRLSKENHTKYYDDDYGEDLEIDNDKEIERLKRILEGFQKGKLEERERISFQVKRLMVDIEKHWDNVPNPKKSVLYGLKQLQKEIGEEKGK